MPAPIDTVRFSSIIEDSVVKGKGIFMRDYHEDILIMPCYESALAWYAKYHPDVPSSHQGIIEAYQWMLLGFEKEVTAKAIDADSSTERINVYLNSLQSFFESHQALKDKYYEVNDKLHDIPFSIEESILPTVSYYQAAVEGAANVLSIGLDIINDCIKKVMIPAREKNSQTPPAYESFSELFFKESDLQYVTEVLRKTTADKKFKVIDSNNLWLGQERDGSRSVLLAWIEVLRIQGWFKFAVSDKEMSGLLNSYFSGLKLKVNDDSLWRKQKNSTTANSYHADFLALIKKHE